MDKLNREVKELSLVRLKTSRAKTETQASLAAEFLLLVSSLPKQLMHVHGPEFKFKSF